MTKDFAQSSRDYLAGMDQEIERLQRLREQIAALLESAPAKADKARKPRKTTKPGRRPMSDAGRAKIAAAQQARWARQKRTAKPAKKTSLKKVSVKNAAANAPAPKKASRNSAAETA